MVVTGPGFANGTIILNEPEAVYYSGQLISGNIHFELTESVAFSAINIVYLGEALVQWSEGQREMYGGARRYREVTYEGREQYFNYVQCVCGGTEMAKDILIEHTLSFPSTTYCFDKPNTSYGLSSLAAGVHSFPFQFEVPFNVPSSFKEERGQISYKITAYFEQPGRREELVKEFKVIAPLLVGADMTSVLNRMQQPLELDFEEVETCQCFCQNKPISIKVCLPTSVFSLGSSIPVTVKVKNKSSVEIYEVLLRIAMRYTYRTQTPRSEYSAPEQEVVMVKKGPIMGNTICEYCWDVKLPDSVLPNLNGCTIIDVAYFFKVKIRMTGCNEDVEDETEILIGLLPSADLSELKSGPLAQKLPKAPIPNPNNPSAFAPNANLKPAQINVPNQSPFRHSLHEAVPNQIPQNVGPNFTDLKSANNPYEIGFKVQNPLPPSQFSNAAQSTGYPHPPKGNAPYPTTGGFGLNLSQTNIVASAPPASNYH